MNVGLAHQPGDLITTDLMTGPPRRLPQFLCSVDAIVRRPDRDQHRDHHRVTHRPRRQRPGLHRVVRARSHLQGLADGLDSELVAVVVDELDDHFCGRSSSAAKKADARFKISFARRNSRFSCSSALIRLRLDGRRARGHTLIDVGLTDPARTDSIP